MVSGRLLRTFASTANGKLAAGGATQRPFSAVAKARSNADLRQRLETAVGERAPIEVKKIKAALETADALKKEKAYNEMSWSSLS